MLIVLALVAGLFAAPVTAAGQLPGHFDGGAWGNRANATAGDMQARLGRAAYQPCPCRGTGGEIRSNGTNDVDAGERYRAAKIVSTAQAMKQSNMRAFAQTTSRVTNITAIGGILTADSMYAVATVRATTTSINVTTEGSAITGLRIDGEPTTVDPGERVNIPGFGYAVFFDVQRSGNGETRRSIQVEMMRLVITRSNSLDIPVGSVIRVAHAAVGYSRQETANVVSAAAWGSQARSTSEDVESGFDRGAPAYLGCFAKGTSSGSNRVDSVTYPGVFHTGTMVNQVYGEVTDTRGTARATSRLEAVNLLDGVVTADVIKGVANASASGAGSVASFDGSRFVNLEVLGVPVGDNVAPNTEIAIPGIGTLTLFATESSRDADEAHASVYMVILEVTAPDTLGVPAGTEIRLARARADAHRP